MQFHAETIHPGRKALSFFLLLLAALSAGAQGSPANPDPKAAAAEIVRQLNAQHFDAVTKQFGESLAQSYAVKDLTGDWTRFSAAAGSLQSVGSTTVVHESSGYTAVTLSCVFDHTSAATVYVVFDKEQRIAGLYFGPQPTDEAKEWAPPEYAVAANFHESPVVVEDGGWHLPGTLTLPNGKGPFPVAILIPGSPPLDQDCTVGPNKIFKDIAWGLASRGIAVLRYTKRTHQYGAGLGSGVSEFSLEEELMEDAKAAIALVMQRPELDAQRVFLVGHSLGGVVVPELAKNNSKIAGIAILASPAESLRTTALRQYQYRSGLPGPEGEAFKEAQAAFERLSSEKAAPDTLETMFGRVMIAQYWKGLANSVPSATASELKIAVLVMLAGHDAEVQPVNYPLWKDALKNHPGANLKNYPDLWHLMIHSSATGTNLETQEDWMRPGHVSPDVVRDLADWIAANSRRQ